MYMDDDTLTPRDRISNDMLLRMLDQTNRGSAETPLPEQNLPQAHDNTRNSLNRLPNHPQSTWGLDGNPLAMTYAPVQHFRKLYDRDTALDKGTIFSELDLPFRGKSVMKGGNCRV